MHSVMQTIPISDLRFQQAKILGQIEQAPIVLTRQGRATAVLVSPAEWNGILQEIEELEDALAVAQTRLALASGVEDLLDWETVKAELNAPAAAHAVRD